MEPDISNYNKLIQLMKDNLIEVNSYRNFIVNAAISDDCINGSISFYKPKPFQGQNISQTLENEFGSLHKGYVNKVVQQFKLSEVKETIVSCKSIFELLRDANIHFLKNKTNVFIKHKMFNQEEYFSFQPLTIRIDTEGYDAKIIHNYFKAIDNNDKIHKNMNQSIISFYNNDKNLTLLPYDYLNCNHLPLVFFWEKNKLSLTDRLNIKTLFHSYGYKDHEDFFKGTWSSQDMYSVLLPSSIEYYKRCSGISLEEGIFI